MKKLYSNKLTIFLFLLPALILFLGILIAPIFMSGILSFYKWPGYGKMEFIGFDNYKELFTGTLYNVIVPFKNAGILIALSLFVQLPLSLFLALILGKGRRGERVFLSIYFIPVLISTVVLGQLWNKIYYPTESGVLNLFLKVIGKPDLIKDWLGTKSTVVPAIMTPVIWQFVGYHMLLFYAGVKSVPPEYREAAMIDGASEWQTNWHIVIPSMAPVIRICVIFAITGSLKSYDLIKVLSGDGAITKLASVPSITMINSMFLSNKYGTGSAIATILIILCFACALAVNGVYRLITKREE